MKLIHTVFSFALLVLPLAAEGQAGVKLDEGFIQSLQWRSIGPASQGGRITDVEALRNRTATIYLGTASGGLFKSVNHGTTWTALFDKQATLSIGDIALSPSNPNHVWVGTGEANNRNSSPWGHGVYRSTDAGQTWSLMGLEETRHVGRVLVHPTDPNIVYVAAVGHLFGPNEERGVYKTTDGGQTWERTLFIDENTGSIDLVMDPTNPDLLYAAMYQRQRRSFGFIGGGPGSGLYKTTNGGQQWIELTEGLPPGDKGRIGLHISESSPNVMMAIVEADEGGIFRSENRGESWTKMNDLNPRPMYYSYLRVDPNDDQHIFVLGSYVHESWDGGATFNRLDFFPEGTYGEGVHVDQQTLWIDPGDSDHMLLGNDGGFYFSFDGGHRWTIVNNLSIGQFYDVAYDMREPYNLYGGLQDNQSVSGPSATRSVKGIMNRHWTMTDFGDGMYQQVDPLDPDFVYTSSQGAGIIRYHPLTRDRKAIRPAPQDTTDTHRFHWTAPFIISPHDPKTILLGGNKLFTTRDRGVTWQESKDLSRQIDRDTLPIMGSVWDSTALSRNDGVSGYGHITTLSESPMRPGLIWVGTDDGNVQVSEDAGASWTELSDNLPGFLPPMFVSRVEASHAEDGRAYITLDGHWDDNYEPYLFVTDDLGQSWQNIGAGLEGPVRVIREHPNNPDALFVGTDLGVFLSLNAGRNWTSLNTNMPRVPIFDLEIHSRDNDLIAGTHGRGIWILDNVGVLTGLTEETMANGLSISPINPATLFQHALDIPRLGHSVFRAPNPTFGAVVTYYLREDAEADATIRIRNQDGRVIRTMSGPGTRGIHRVAWDLRLQPLEIDTLVFEISDYDVGPQGPFIMAGEYQVEVRAGQLSATQAVQVRSDPAMPISPEEQRARYEFTVNLYRLQSEEYHTAVQANLLERSANAATDSVGELSNDAHKRIRELVEHINSVANDIRGQNNSLRSWWRGLIGEFDGGLNTQGTMTGPTGAQTRRYERTRGEFSTVVEALDRVIVEVVPELNKLLKELGLGPVEVPVRGGQDLVT